MLPHICILIFISHLKWKLLSWDPLYILVPFSFCGTFIYVPNRCKLFLILILFHPFPLFFCSLKIMIKQWTISKGDQTPRPTLAGQMFCHFVCPSPPFFIPFQHSVGDNIKIFNLSVTLKIFSWHIPTL